MLKDVVPLLLLAVSLQRPHCRLLPDELGQLPLLDDPPDLRQVRVLLDECLLVPVD